MLNETIGIAAPKAKLVNVIPTKDNVDYNTIYYYNNAEILKNFKFIGFNRELRKENVNCILRQIKDETYGGKFIPAILVDINTLYVIDGQHRLTAYEKAMADGIDTEIKVVYEDIPEEYTDDILRLLQEAKKWDNKDYFHRAIVNGNVACKELEEWCFKHSDLCCDKNGKPNRSYAMSFMYGHRMDKEVKDLSIKPLQKKEKEFAEQIYNEVYGMFQAMKYKRANFIEGMTQSWYELRKDKNSTANYFINDMGMGFVYDNIYSELNVYQPTSKKIEWDYKFGQIINNLYRKFREKSSVAA